MRTAIWNPKAAGDALQYFIFISNLAITIRIWFLGKYRLHASDRRLDVVVTWERHSYQNP